ncbi:hypothetical protein HDV57DRAFT_17002 [Trichoderma longibrachiatum]|uniref:Uncharacterized protein n=1 Tax=Trichoderma longibrachiatum ATCC 18648 TaxID=983965 RepID=A0A2T4CIY9_TRILO|nr:hypothetical protein M440DRAFT_1396692 [Trichoderma longibrachiatum ATCC 18648]
MTRSCDECENISTIGKARGDISMLAGDAHFGIQTWTTMGAACRWIGACGDGLFTAHRPSGLLGVVCTWISFVFRSRVDLLAALGGCLWRRKLHHHPQPVRLGIWTSFARDGDLAWILFDLHPSLLDREVVRLGGTCGCGVFVPASYSTSCWSYACLSSHGVVISNV